MPDSQAEKPPITYMPQLDGLRALAVFGVWISHWGSLGGRWDLLGPLGVRLFFVLSGFLISGILLSVKRSVEAGTESVFFAARRFYWRRCLRIFPIYYLTLLVALPVIGQIRPHALYDLTYTSNFFFAGHGRLDTTDAHLWTLSVEEQFYIVWPWVILCIRRQFLVPVITATLAIGPVSRGVLSLIFHRTLAAYVLPFGSLDAFALGGLLALFGDARQNSARTLLRHWGLALGLPAAIGVSWLFPQNLESPWFMVIFPLATAGASVWVIGGAARGFGGIIGALLKSQPLVYLGKISYGLYLYHGFVSWAMGRALEALHCEPRSVLLYFVLRAAFTILVAAASWHLIERPVSRLKRSFSYTPEQIKPPQAVAVTGD